VITFSIDYVDTEDINFNRMRMITAMLKSLLQKDAVLGSYITTNQEKSNHIIARKCITFSKDIHSHSFLSP
jgi:hypothetical protein